MFQLNLPSYPTKIISRAGKDYIFCILRKRYVRLTPEEWVRQHFVHYLIEQKHYPKGLLGNEVSLTLHGMQRRADSVLMDRHGEPLMIVEYKAPNVVITQEVFNQICAYNQVLRVRYLCVTNGMVLYLCRLDYDTGKVHFLEQMPDYEQLLP